MLVLALALALAEALEALEVLEVLKVRAAYTRKGDSRVGGSLGLDGER